MEKKENAGQDISTPTSPGQSEQVENQGDFQRLGSTPTPRKPPFWLFLSKQGYNIKNWFLRLSCLCLPSHLFWQVTPVSTTY